MTITIALMMEAVRTSESSVNFYETTRRHVPEGYHLYACHRENLKSHNFHCCLFNMLTIAQIICQVTN
jgi:hypothetical protein